MICNFLYERKRSDFQSCTKRTCVHLRSSKLTFLQFSLPVWNTANEWLSKIISKGVHMGIRWLDRVVHELGISPPFVPHNLMTFKSDVESTNVTVYCMWSLVRPVLLCDIIFGKKIRLQYKRNFPSVYWSVCLLKLGRFSWY